MRIKKAFTLGETLLVFVIIGIIAAISLSTVKPWQKAFKYSYSRMYNALSLSIYNYMIHASTNDSFPATGDDLCKALLEYINTSDNASSCHGANIGFNPTSFPDDKVRIRASNGTKIWIGTNTDNKPLILNQSLGGSITDTVRYYMIFVDLNGDKMPNTAEWTKTQMADIVAFVLTDKFAVIPIGYPEVDSRYLVAHVVYPSLNTEYSEADTNSAKYTGDEEVVSDPMTYYEARINAYGDNTFAGNIGTYDFRNILPSGSYFRVDDYSKYYTTLPTFDTLSCALDGSTDSEPVCSVKIYDYH